MTSKGWRIYMMDGLDGLMSDESAVDWYADS